MIRKCSSEPREVEFYSKKRLLALLRPAFGDIFFFIIYISIAQDLTEIQVFFD